MGSNDIIKPRSTVLSRLVIESLHHRIILILSEKFQERGESNPGPLGCEARTLSIVLYGPPLYGPFHWAEINICSDSERVCELFHFTLNLTYSNLTNLWQKGSGCGSANKGVLFEPRDSWFESQQLQNFVYLLEILLRGETTFMERKAGNGVS